MQNGTTSVWNWYCNVLSAGGQSRLAQNGKDLTKSRGTCNGSPRFFSPSSIGETYAACVEQPIHRLTWALSAALGLICKGYDVGNAFAEAPASKFNFYMKPDKQFCQWQEMRHLISLG